MLKHLTFGLLVSLLLTAPLIGLIDVSGQSTGRTALCPL